MSESSTAVAGRIRMHLTDAKRIAGLPYGDSNLPATIDDAKRMLDDERRNPGKYELMQMELATDMVHPPESSDDDDEKTSKSADTPSRQSAIQRLSRVFTPNQMKRITVVFDRQPKMYDTIRTIQDGDLYSRVRSMIVIDPTCRCGYEFEPVSDHTKIDTPAIETKPTEPAVQRTILPTDARKSTGWHGWRRMLIFALFIYFVWLLHTFDARVRRQVFRQSL